MPKYNPENERVKRDYVTHLRLAQGKQEDSWLPRWPPLIGLRDQPAIAASSLPHRTVKAFREKISQPTGHARTGSAQRRTVTSTLRNLKAFFTWLAERPGYRSWISISDAEYFNPTVAHVRIAAARREARVRRLRRFSCLGIFVINLNCLDKIWE